MTIRYDMITEINDVEFDRMFNDCIDNMNAGSYPWEITPVATATNEEKKVYIKTCFQEFINVANGVVFVCSEDGYALTISSGFVNGTHFEGHMVLIGRNQAGSKSFMYHDDYHTAREAFWDEVNFVTWDFQTHTTIIVATAVTEHTLGNSSLKLTKHEQTEIVSDEGE